MFALFPLCVSCRPHPLDIITVPMCTRGIYAPRAPHTLVMFLACISTCLDWGFACSVCVFLMSAPWIIWSGEAHTFVMWYPPPQHCTLGIALSPTCVDSTFVIVFGRWQPCMCHRPDWVFLEATPHAHVMFAGHMDAHTLVYVVHVLFVLSCALSVVAGPGSGEPWVGVAPILHATLYRLFAPLTVYFVLLTWPGYYLGTIGSTCVFLLYLYS